MHILIVSSPYDTHADAVIWGLQQLGHLPTVFFAQEFPAKNSINLSIGNDVDQKIEFSIQGNAVNAAFDVVWNRRNGDPVAMADSHPLDVKIIKQESKSCIENVFYALNYSDAIWVNSKIAEISANNKSIQLTVAKKVGFKIPDTLISNNPDEIRKFFYNNKEIIFKSFNLGGWIQKNGSLRVLKTALVKNEHLLDDQVLQSCPGIFQCLIKKNYEIRVTVIGEQIFSGAIYSQSEGETIDWRYDYKYGNTPVSLIELPDKVKLKCFELCKQLGLVFACIDLVFDEHGDYVFLEVNPAGQFLWKEDAEPALPMLDVFCQFLANGGKSDYKKCDAINFASYRDSDRAKYFNEQVSLMSESSPLLTKESE